MPMNIRSNTPQTITRNVIICHNNYKLIKLQNNCKKSFMRKDTNDSKPSDSNGFRG